MGNKTVDTFKLISKILCFFKVFSFVHNFFVVVIVVVGMGRCVVRRNGSLIILKRKETFYKTVMS